MKPFLSRYHRPLFYGTWLLLGLLQARFTELLDDEAYYWVFSRFLDWGYFDHPPMTALLIKIGYAVFENELGVRLLMLLLSTATLYLCEGLLRFKNAFLFYAVAAALAVLQIGGILAVPDIPLLFFTALFFTVYQQFEQKLSVLHTVALALATACLLYSKYHAVLIVFFTLLSNLSLFKRWQTYAAGLLALLLFLPHLCWQYQHNWISFRYHLFESNVNPYKINYSTDYVLGQLLIAGPLAGFLLWPVTFLYKPQTPTERALKFTGVGIFIFFFLSTFKGKVEANWTAPAIIPILVLSHQYLLGHLNAKKWLFRLAVPTLVLVLVLRIIMVVDVVPAKAVRERFHYYKNWPGLVQQKTEGLPIVLSSSYQKSSKYWFYSGQTTYSLNEHKYRRNNYNFWPIEDSLLGKTVYLFDAPQPAPDSVATPLGMLFLRRDSFFYAFTKINFLPAQKTFTVRPGHVLSLTADLTMPAHYRQFLKQYPQVDAGLKIGVYNSQKWLHDVPQTATLRLLLQQDSVRVQVPLALQPGTYYLRFALGSSTGWYTHNSEKIKVLIN